MRESYRVMYNLNYTNILESSHIIIDTTNSETIETTPPGFAFRKISETKRYYYTNTRNYIYAKLRETIRETIHETKREKIHEKNTQIYRLRL